MKTKPIIIVSGEPYSVFLEIFFKIFKSKFFINYKKPIILIASKKLVEMQMKKMNFSIKINLLDKKKISSTKINNSKINLIDVHMNINKPFGKISDKSSKYIDYCFNLGVKILNDGKGSALINGPISKKHFLNSIFSVFRSDSIDL